MIRDIGSVSSEMPFYFGVCNCSCYKGKKRKRCKTFLKHHA